MDSQTRIRIYVDGETAQNVSLDFNLFLAHAVGVDDAQQETAWGEGGEGAVVMMVVGPCERVRKSALSHLSLL
jgi:hypothetical protein